MVPPIFSLRNLSVIQIQQEFRYLPETISNVGGQVGRDRGGTSRCVVSGRARNVGRLVVEALVTCALRICWRRDDESPLSTRDAPSGADVWISAMLNGIALMVLGALDRVIVVNLFDLAALAKYSLAANLVIAPVSILIEILSKVGMPLIARARADQGASNRASLIVLMAVLLSGRLSRYRSRFSSIGVAACVWRAIPSDAGL